MPYVKCTVCEKEFYAKPKHLKIGWSKHCSIECRSKGQVKGTRKKCDNCGKVILRTRAQMRKSKLGKFFCSKSCTCIWMNKNVRLSENHGNWNNGQATYRNRLKRSKQKRECQECGIDDKRVLIVHHKDKNRSNNRIENLVWLCCNCHFLKHHHKTKTK